MTEQEFLKSARLEKKTSLRGRLSRLMSIRENLSAWLRSRSSKAAGFLGIREAHELDERSKQLWATHGKGQLEKPRSPMDILR